jgi:malate dehydrogenase (oxaloacetate-decarboxylating)
MTRFAEHTDPTTGVRQRVVSERGAALQDDPLLNKGTCFTQIERDTLGLAGLLPPAIQTEDEQLARAYENYQRAAGDVARYLFLASLQDRNETLFCRLVLDHLQEMIPIVYTPTVGQACEQFSHIYRRPRGLYVSPAERGRIREVLRNAAVADPQVIVVTDNEAILGIGDQGVGGMPIAIGKLALYTVGAGIHPAACLPLDLDVGTERPDLLSDPLYLGVRQRRLRGERYFALLDELVEAIADVFPNALLQWEDFASANAFAVLRRYRRRLLTFNDDIQGTGAVVVAGIRTALTRVGSSLEQARVVFYGAGASGVGCALALRAAMRALGLPESELAMRVLSLDSKGLLISDRVGLDGPKREIATDPAFVASWFGGLGRANPPSGTLSLTDVVRHYKPTVLVGVSGQSGAFTETIVRDMQASCARPIVLPLSNPTSKVEAAPAELLRWTNGAAVVGTGSPFADVEINGRTVAIGQGNNVLIFPGVGLGATTVKATWLPDEAFAAAAAALAAYSSSHSWPGDPIYPPLTELRDVSRSVAIAVGTELVRVGAAPPMAPHEIKRRVTGNMWMPEYVPYVAAPGA